MLEDGHEDAQLLKDELSQTGQRSTHLHHLQGKAEKEEKEKEKKKEKEREKEEEKGEGEEEGKVRGSEEEGSV